MTPEDREVAPGPLGQLQRFMNSGHLEANDWLSPESVEAMRRRAASGEARATIARDFGVPQGLISAVARGAAVYDDLFSVETAADWLVEYGLLDQGEGLGPADLPLLIELRDLLRRAAEANTDGSAVAPDVTDGLNRLAAEALLTTVFAGPALEGSLRPAGGSRPVAALIAILFEAVRDGSWKRLKRCPGHGCPFTFYDSSRNRTGTWCSMSVCGNRAKVRKYQERRRARLSR